MVPPALFWPHGSLADAVQAFRGRRFLPGALVSPARPSHALPGTPETGSKLLRESQWEEGERVMKAGPLEEINMKDRASKTPNLHKER